MLDHLTEWHQAMFLEFLESAGSVVAILAGIALFFWTSLTLAIHRLKKGETVKDMAKETESLEKEIDEIIVEIRKNNGRKTHPPITA